MEISDNYTNFIKSIFNKYSEVSDTSIKRVAAISKIQHLEKGQYLLEIGASSKHKHILYKGAIVSTFIDSNGNVYHKNIFLKGDFVGSTVSAIIGKPSHFALEAIAPSTLISFDYNTYKHLIEEHKDLNDFYIAYLEKNWVIDKEQREIDIVMKDARSRYLELISNHPNMERLVPLRYIASHLGITPTQLSRIRKNL